MWPQCSLKLYVYIRIVKYGWLGITPEVCLLRLVVLLLYTILYMQLHPFQHVLWPSTLAGLHLVLNSTECSSLLSSSKWQKGDSAPKSVDAWIDMASNVHNWIWIWETLPQPHQQGQQLQVTHFYTLHSHSVLHIHQLETTLAYLYQHVHVNVLRPGWNGSVGPYERASRCADIRSHTPHVTQDTGHSLVLHTHHGKDRCATAS